MSDSVLLRARWLCVLVLVWILSFGQWPQLRAQATKSNDPLAYPSVKQLGKRIKQIQQSYRAATASPWQVETYGKSSSGQDLHAIVLSYGVSPKDLPGIGIVAGTDGRWLLGTEVALRMAELVLNDSDWRKTLEHYSIYIIPAANPDALDAFQTLPTPFAHWLPWAYDDDRDRLVDEDGPAPFPVPHPGYHGWQMRWADPAGKFTPHPQDPRVMVAAKADTPDSLRYQYHPSSRDPDRDGRYAEDPAGGVDFHRNWPFLYPNFQSGSGPYPVFTPEMQALADYLTGLRNLAAVYTIGPYDNVLSPWQAPSQTPKLATGLHPADSADQARLTQALRKPWPKGLRAAGIPALPVAPTDSGQFAPWAYSHLGCWTISSAGWHFPEAPNNLADSLRTGADSTHWLRRTDANPLVSYRAWQDSAFYRDYAARSWEPILETLPSHLPQGIETLPLAPSQDFNPPLTWLDSLTQLHLACIRALIELLPELELTLLKKTPLGGELFQIELQLRNKGQLATHTQPAAANKRTTNIGVKFVSMDKDQSIIAGKQVHQIPLIKAGESHTFQYTIQGKGILLLDANAPHVKPSRLKIVLE